MDGLQLIVNRMNLKLILAKKQRHLYQWCSSMQGRQDFTLSFFVANYIPPKDLEQFHEQIASRQEKKSQYNPSSSIQKNNNGISGVNFRGIKSSNTEQADAGAVAKARYDNYGDYDMENLMRILKRLLKEKL